MSYRLECSISFRLIHSKVSFNNFTKNNAFSQSFQKLFSSSAIIFVGLVESRETSKREPSYFRVMNIPEKPQAACHHHSALKYDQLARVATGSPHNIIHHHSA